MTVPERRNPFANQPPPAPFYASPEFRRSAVLILALGVFFVVAAWRYFDLQEQIELESPPQSKGTFATPTSDEVLERERKLLSVFEGALVDQENGADYVETPGSRKLLELVAGYRPEEVTERATRWLDWRQALADPNALRGEFVRARGVLAGYWPQRLERPIQGRKDVWRGAIVGDDPEVPDGVVFAILDRPDDLTEENVHRGTVDLEGVFYRTLTYEAEDGRTRTAPYVIARNLRATYRGSDRAFWSKENTWFVLAISAFVILAARLLISWFRRTQRGRGLPPGNPTIREMMDQRVAEMRRRGPPPAPPGSNRSST